MDIIKMQETPRGTLVIVDVNQGDMGKFYRRIYRRVALIETGTKYVSIRHKNVLEDFGYCEYNYYGCRGGGTYFNHARLFADKIFEVAMTHMIS